ncbi:hypothetical protein GALMADRAFT_122854 [Galerina marginata CBS 339.88]|uniref:Uncharacterized protein n=1 Tax=Galerina marginata (strain CBS 339.88) TaxID=685588 RepID=A0A067T5I6_GALM3|nr:hypothetical protein GALMADRAFT_122854 [Galerina marginata CBS 339.88]
MSGPSYRLQASRPRQPPSPLNFDNSFQSSSVVSSNHDSQTLLYDLPSTVSMSPPTSPKSVGRMISPSSPSFPGRSKVPRSGRPTPPPSSRNRSATPSGVASSELELFAEYCRAWYYCQDDNSGRLMTQTLATLPPSQRAPFSRLQASIRSAYHRSVNARRHAEFQAHLSATTPGGSLMPHARLNPREKTAQKERYERMERFVRNWCNAGMPGTKPFFEALWALMRLQVIPEDLGGAGRNRIEWEFDDAVFKEAAGKDFMLEAIDFLKGVLAFEETPSLKISGTSYGHRKDSSLPAIHSRAQSQPLPSHQKVEVTPTVQPKRSRAPSDPFLDAPHSRSLGTSSHSPNTESLLAFTGTDGEESPSPVAPYGDTPSHHLNEGTYDDADEQYLRVWTSPDLANPEILQLLELFPSFVSRRPLPRFPLPQSRHVDIEEGEDEGLEGRQIHFGTGSMWVSSKQRSDAWEGGWWTRFIMWWRRIFC